MKLALEIVLTDMTLKWCTLCNSYLELVLIALKKWCTLCNSYLELVLIALKIIVSLVFILLRACLMLLLFFTLYHMLLIKDFFNKNFFNVCVALTICFMHSKF